MVISKLLRRLSIFGKRNDDYLKLDFTCLKVSLSITGATSCPSTIHTMAKL
jgi:hypothetical protein